MKMRLYRISNKARRGCWIFAASEARAKELALADGFVKRLENITSLKDQTEFFRIEEWGRSPQ
jgi:hypothetical protein